MENVRRRANGGALAVIIAAVAFALAVLCAGTFGTPVKAAEWQSTNINVNLTAKHDTPVKATISFKVENVEENGSNTINGQTVKTGISGVTINPIAFDSTSQTNPDSGNYDSATGKDTYSKAASASIDTKQNPDYGVYHYKITPVDGTIGENGAVTGSAGLDDADATTHELKSQAKDLYVYIVDNNGTKSAYGVIYEGNESKKSASFDVNYPSHNLKIKKIVTGNTGNTNQAFSFTATINGVEGRPYTYVVSDGGKTTTTIILDANNKNINFNLKNGEYIIIYGLTATDTVEYHETPVTGYAASYHNGDLAASALNDNNKIFEKEDGAGVTVAAGSSDVAQTVQNDSTTNPPTGLIYNPMTYIILIAVAAVLGTLLYRRKHAYDDED